MVLMVLHLLMSWTLKNYAIYLNQQTLLSNWYFESYEEDGEVEKWIITQDRWTFYNKRILIDFGSFKYSLFLFFLS